MYENACYTNTEDSCHYVYDTDYVEKCYTKYTRYCNTVRVQLRPSTKLRSLKKQGPVLT